MTERAYYQPVLITDQGGTTMPCVNTCDHCDSYVFRFVNRFEAIADAIRHAKRHQWPSGDLRNRVGMTPQGYRHWREREGITAVS